MQKQIPPKGKKMYFVMRAEERLQKAQEQENRAQTLIAKYKKRNPSADGRAEDPTAGFTGKF